MAGVVVAALKEAFDRDTRRLELERDQLAAERERAERALRLELQRQAADREIGRLRLLAGVAVAGWLVTLLLAIWPGSRMVATTVARVALGGGWLLLGAALAASFSAQARVAAALDSGAGCTIRRRRCRDVGRRGRRGALADRRRPGAGRLAALIA